MPGKLAGILLVTARLLMIALDGADSSLVERWSSDGTLPNIAALRARGHASRIAAPSGVTDDGLWASIQYAASLGEHGRYFWRQRLRNGKLGMAFADEGELPRFWDGLSDAGKRVAILDVPKCAAPRPLNGIHLADWLVHGRYFHKPRSYPESLASEVVATYGAAPPSRCAEDLPALDDAGVMELAGHLHQSIAQKCAAAAHFLDSEPWDLFVVGFKEAHCAGHGLWDLADPAHPEHDAARNARLGEPLRAVLTAIDHAVGELVAKAGPTASVIVFSTTELAPNGSAIHLMPEITGA